MNAAVLSPRTRWGPVNRDRSVSTFSSFVWDGCSGLVVGGTTVSRGMPAFAGCCRGPELLPQASRLAPYIGIDASNEAFCTPQSLDNITQVGGENVMSSAEATTTGD